MSSDVAAYVQGIDPARRPLFDRVHRLVLEVHPDAQVVLSYGMPTYVVAAHQLHVGVWKHGLSFYGWQQGHDGGLAQRYPRLDNGRGTLKLPLEQAAEITDDELRAFLAAALTTATASVHDPAAHPARPHEPVGADLTTPGTSTREPRR